MAKNTGFLSAHRLGRKILKEMNRRDGLCAFGIQGDTNDDSDFRINAACHASLVRMNVEGEYKYMVDAIYPRGKKINTNMAKMFTNYVLKQSPYSPMFAEKNINKGFARGYYLFNTDVDANLLTGGAVLLRMLSEVPTIPEVWYHMVKAGADADVAVLLAHMSGIEDGKFYINNYSDAGHRALVPTWFDENSVAGFINGKHKNYGKYNVKKRYAGFNGMWREKRGNLMGNNFGDTIYKAWMKVLHDRNADLDGRVALFDHDGQADRDVVVAKLPYKEAMPIIAKILNDYRGGLNVA